MEEWLIKFSATAAVFCLTLIAEHVTLGRKFKNNEPLRRSIGITTGFGAYALVMPFDVPTLAGLFLLFAIGGFTLTILAKTEEEAEEKKRADLLKGEINQAVNIYGETPDRQRN